MVPVVEKFKVFGLSSELGVKERGRCPLYSKITLHKEGTGGERGALSIFFIEACS